MKLIIVESPTKTKSLAKYLGSDYDVLATMGHIRDLPKSKMGVEIRSHESTKSRSKGYEFVPEYVENPDKIETIKKLQTAAKKAEVILLASDPDREGEAIAWHTSELLRNSNGKLKIDNGKIKRVTFHSITKEAILEAIKNPREIDMNMVEAQQARRVLDRIVGYQLSPILWRKVRRGLSAGRVQSVATRMIVEREKEIEAFKAEEYWEIRVEVAKLRSHEGTNGSSFWVELIKINGKNTEINNGEEANKIKNDLDKGEYLVDKVEKKERKVYSHPPFKTSTLQQAAANVLGWSAKKSMQVAQSLYEKGAITYHRTDSLNLVETEVEKIRTYIANKYGVEALPEKALVYKTGGKVVAQEAHEAIRPTDVQRSEIRDQGTEVDKDDEKLYQLIWRRTVSCQMAPARVDQTNVYVICDKYLLRATGEAMKFASWKKLYQGAGYKEQGSEIELPEVSQGEKLEKKEIKLDQKFTLPPARFNDASLVKEMEKRGIGRPSTYAPTISTIIVRGYVERKQKKFYATPIGITVTDFLVKNFPKELDYDFTAKMETGLDEIANGEKDWQEVLSDFYGPFAEDVAKSGDAERAKVPVESTGKKCPLCNEGEIVIRTGKFGKFLSCNRFPECKYTDKYVEYVEDVVCPKCSGRIIKKKTKTGRDFYGCENYPNCDYASWTKPGVVEKAE